MTLKEPGVVGQPISCSTDAYVLWCVLVLYMCVANMTEGELGACVQLYWYTESPFEISVRGVLEFVV